MVVDWKDLTTFEINDAEIRAPWILVLESFEGATHLRIRAEGSWTVMDGLLAKCEPDGLSGVPLMLDRLVVADCPVGALIGKIGRSSAAVSPAVAASADAPAIGEGKAFAIGSHCVSSIPEKSMGPLFVGFNCLARPVKVARLRIVVAAATIPS